MSVFHSVSVLEVGHSVLVMAQQTLCLLPVRNGMQVYEEKGVIGVMNAELTSNYKLQNFPG